jgi:hypothetical protein
MPIKYSSTLRVNDARGVSHSTGVIPYDLNQDGISDLIFLPTRFNARPELAAFSIESNGNGAAFSQQGFWNDTFTTGFVKDWWLTDINQDGRNDVVWVDHGLELSPDLGGFQNGLNASLLSNSSGKFDYMILPGNRAFYHGGGVLQDSKIVAADFSNQLVQYAFANGRFVQSTLSLGSDFGFSNPGAVNFIQLEGGNVGVIAASYQRPNQFHPAGQVIVYTSGPNNSLSKETAISFPVEWNNSNLGAFSIVSDDFRNKGFDDFILLGETASLQNSIRDVRYFKQMNGAFRDVTDSAFGAVKNLINQPDKLMPFDVNRDGHLDLIGMSYKTGSYASGFGIFINDGMGRFGSLSLGDSSFKQSTNFPIFSTKQDGSWDSLIGVYGISTPNPNTMTVTQWLSDTTLFSGPNWINPALKGVPGFSELYYLNTYADAANAVSNGTYASGLDFYLSIGKNRGDDVCAPGTTIYGISNDVLGPAPQQIAPFKFNASSKNYAITLNATNPTVLNKLSESAAPYTFIDIRRLQFTDTNVALDIGPSQNAGSVYMLYKAAFNRPSDAGGMGYWISLKDGGADIVTSIAQGFVNSAEFIGKYGSNPTNASYISNLYQNVLGRAGEAGGVAYWTGEMNAGRVSKAQALVQFATLPEGAGIVAPLIANGIQYQEWVG